MERRWGWLSIVTMEGEFGHPGETVAGVSCGGAFGRANGGEGGKGLLRQPLDLRQGILLRPEPLEVQADVLGLLGRDLRAPEQVFEGASVRSLGLRQAEDDGEGLLFATEVAPNRLARTRRVAPDAEVVVAGLKGVANASPNRSNGAGIPRTPPILRRARMPFSNAAVFPATMCQ